MPLLCAAIVFPFFFFTQSSFSFHECSLSLLSPIPFLWHSSIERYGISLSHIVTLIYLRCGIISSGHWRQTQRRRKRCAGWWALCCWPAISRKWLLLTYVLVLVLVLYLSFFRLVVAACHANAVENFAHFHFALHKCLLIDDNTSVTLCSQKFRICVNRFFPLRISQTTTYIPSHENQIWIYRRATPQKM